MGWMRRIQKRALSEEYCIHSSPCGGGGRILCDTQSYCTVWPYIALFRSEKGEQTTWTIQSLKLKNEYNIIWNYQKIYWLSETHSTSGVIPKGDTRATELQPQNCAKKCPPEKLIPILYLFRFSTRWSFGIVLYEIYTLGGVPYPGLDGFEVVRKLEDGYRMEQPDECPDGM